LVTGLRGFLGTLFSDVPVLTQFPLSFSFLPVGQTQTLSLRILPPVHPVVVVGTWQSSPTVPPRQTHCPPLKILGNGHDVCVPPQLPSCNDRALQHWPLTMKFGGYVQVVVVFGVGQSLPMQVGSTGCGQLGPRQPGSTK
jgi:hypothetical protein